MNEFKLKEKIKILHILSRVTGREDGVFKHLMSQIKFLDRSKFEHKVILPYSREIQNRLNEFAVKNFFCSTIDTNNVFLTLYKINKVIRKEKFDIICCHALKPFLIGGILGLFRNVKVVFFSHGIALKNDYNTALERIIYKLFFNFLLKLKTIYILCPSKKAIEFLKNDLNKINNISVYYDGAAIVENSNSYINETEKSILINNSSVRIVWAGRLAREKDPLLAVKIIEMLPSEQKNISLHFFGEGELERTLKDYIHHKNIKNIFFHGFIRDVNRLFRYFDILLLTSKREGMPVVIWEALVCGLPFVSTNVGGIEEILEYGQCGFLFDSTQEGVEKLKLLIIDSGLRKKMGNKGKLIVQNYFTKQNFINFFSEYYQKIIHE